MRLQVEKPFRLETTVRLLQRRSTNPLDRWIDGAWLRLLERPEGLLLLEVSQPDEGALQLRFPDRKPAPAEAREVVALVRRTLGLDVDLAPFFRTIRAYAGERAREGAGQPRPTSLVRLLEGVRPPRFTSLYEAILGVVPFQQVSLDAGMTIFGRLVERHGASLLLDGTEFHAAPGPEAIAAAATGELRAHGFSATKAHAIQHAAIAILEGELQEAEIEALPTRAAHDRLIELPGIGPWSADLILLRGFGRLDAFPPRDVGVARGLAGLLGAGLDPDELALRFAPQQGMLYFSSLVAQLASRGLVRL